MTRYEKFAELAYRVACGMRCNHGCEPEYGSPCTGCLYKEEYGGCTGQLLKDVAELKVMIVDFAPNVDNPDYGCEEVEE